MREYRVDVDERKRSAIKRIAQGLAVGFGITLAIKLARGNPLLAFDYSDLIIVFLLPVIFFFRGRWGDRLVFDQGTLSVYRGDALRQTIPLADIEKVSKGEGSVTLKWRSGTQAEHQVIASEGFSDAEWNEIQTLLERGKDV